MRFSSIRRPDVRDADALGRGLVEAISTATPLPTTETSCAQRPGSFARRRERRHGNDPVAQASRQARDAWRSWRP